MYNKEYYWRILMGLAIILFMIQLLITGLKNFSINIAINSASFAISTVFILHVVFSKWLWKCKIFKPLIVKVPNLHGTWKGSLISYWKDPQTGKQISPIELKAYIRQTFDTISLEVHTDKMVSTSYVANFVTDPETGIQDLFYIYISKSYLESRESNPWHEGAAKLSIYDGSNLRLEGEYWTSRETTGTIKLTRESTNINRD